MIESPRQCHKWQVKNRGIGREEIKIPISAGNLTIHQNAMKYRQVIRIN